MDWFLHDWGLCHERIKAESILDVCLGSECTSERIIKTPT